MSVRRGPHEVVPMAASLIEAGDRLTAVVAPEAAAAVPLLRRGTTAGDSR